VRVRIARPHVSWHLIYCTVYTSAPGQKPAWTMQLSFQHYPVLTLPVGQWTGPTRTVMDTSRSRVKLRYDHSAGRKVRNVCLSGLYCACACAYVWRAPTERQARHLRSTPLHSTCFDVPRRSISSLFARHECRRWSDSLALAFISKTIRAGVSTVTTLTVGTNLRLLCAISDGGYRSFTAVSTRFHLPHQSGFPLATIINHRLHSSDEDNSTGASMNRWSESSWKVAKLLHAAHDPASRRHCIDESPLMFYYRLQIKPCPRVSNAGFSRDAWRVACRRKTTTKLHLHERWMTVHRLCSQQYN